MELIKVEGLNKLIQQVENGEINPTKAYIGLKDFEKEMKKVYKQIEQYTVDEVEANKSEYPDFSISVRKTYNYKENPDYLKKYEELKEIESTIKTASEMSEKGGSYVDKDGVIIDPVSLKYTQILTYRPNNKGI